MPASERIESADRFLVATRATIQHGGNMAFYAPARDVIQMPPFEAFKDKESYYATALHELTHYTKHPSRLNRDFGATRYGDTGYSREELVAELGAAFLCADLGITPEIRADHADYIGHWLNVLREDKRAISAQRLTHSGPQTICTACSRTRTARRPDGRPPISPQRSNGNLVFGRSSLTNGSALQVLAGAVSSYRCFATSSPMARNCFWYARTLVHSHRHGYGRTPAQPGRYRVKHL